MFYYVELEKLKEYLYFRWLIKRKMKLEFYSSRFKDILLPFDEINNTNIVNFANYEIFESLNFLELRFCDFTNDEINLFFNFYQINHLKILKFTKYKIKNQPLNRIK
jgi:hypothetical protein